MVWWFAGIISAAVLLYFVNEKGIFYSESAEYRKPDLQNLFDPIVKPVSRKLGNDRVILCIHGFPSTPAAWQYFIPLAERAGYDIEAPLLPGHGTVPKDLLGTNFSQYYAAVKDCYLELCREYREVYILGLSMGGLLTLKLAEEFSAADKRPKAICTAAAPVFINRIYPYLVVKNLAFYPIRMISWFFKTFKSELSLPGDPGTGKDGDEVWTGYNGYYPKQLFSLKLGMKHVERNLGKITIPTLLIHAEGDRIVPFQNLSHISKHIGSREVTTRVLDLSIWNHSRHSLFLYQSIREELSLEILTFLREFQNTF